MHANRTAAPVVAPPTDATADIVVRSLLAPRGQVDAELIGRAALIAGEVGYDVTTGARDGLLEVELVVGEDRVDEALAVLEARLGVPRQTDRWILAA